MCMSMRFVASWARLINCQGDLAIARLGACSVGESTGGVKARSLDRDFELLEHGAGVGIELRRAATLGRWACLGDSGHHHLPEPNHDEDHRSRPRALQRSCGHHHVPRFRGSIVLAFLSLRLPLIQLCAEVADPEQERGAIKPLRRAITTDRCRARGG